jgi:hypothetical protein
MYIDASRGANGVTRNWKPQDRLAEKKTKGGQREEKAI